MQYAYAQSIIGRDISDEVVTRIWTGDLRNQDSLLGRAKRISSSPQYPDLV